MTRDELTEIARHYQRNMTGDGFLFGAEEFTAFCNELIEQSALREASAASNERDSAMARVAMLRETLAGLEQFFLRSDEDSNEKFERIGQAFYKATGMLRPGKDASMCCGYTYEEREQAFDDWCKNHLNAARNALEATR